MPVHRLDRRATGLNSAARTWAGTGCHARLPVQEHGDGDLTAPCPCRRIRAAKRMALDPPATHEFVRPAHQALVWSLSVAAWVAGRSHPPAAFTRRTPLSSPTVPPAPGTRRP